MLRKKVFQLVVCFCTSVLITHSCTNPAEDPVNTIGKIEIKGDDNPLKVFDFILIKDSSRSVKPFKGPRYPECNGGVITYCRLGLINHVKEIYLLDYSCVEHFGVSTKDSKATILPQTINCNVSWALQRTLRLGDTLFTNFRICSGKDTPVQFEWVLSLFEKKADGEPFFGGAVKREASEATETLKLVSKTFIL